MFTKILGVVIKKQCVFIAFFCYYSCFYDKATYKADERILRPRGKREGRGTLQTKRAENVQGLEVNFGKLLMVYFMRPSDREALGVMRPLGACGLGEICLPAPPSQQPWQHIHGNKCLNFLL